MGFFQERNILLRRLLGIPELPVSGGTGKVEHAQRVFNSKVHMLYEGSLASPISNTILGTLYIWAVWPFMPARSLLIWLIFLGSISLYRQLLFLRYFQVSRESLEVIQAEKWLVPFFAGSTLTAICWAASCYFFFPEGKPVPQLINVFILAGVTAGAVSTLSAVRQVALSFLWTVLLVVIVKLLLEPGSLALSLALMSVCFLGFMTRVSAVISKMIHRSLKLSSEKDLLLKEISDKKVQVERSNIQLQNALVAANSASEAKSNFLANMSHEIRTPMNAIIGMTELAIEETADQKLKENLEIVRSSAERLLSVINDILDISKIEAGQMSICPLSTNLRGELAKIFDLFRTQVMRKSLNLTTEIDQQIPEALLIDSVRVCQVLVNLIGNAIKFTPSGGQILVSVKVLARESEGMRVAFSVKDSGIGIRTDQLNRIFSPFAQGDESSVRKYEGTGLGLAICAQLVELMGGKIQVESTPGEGSLFHFELIFQEAEVGSADIDRLNSQQVSDALNILLVEDNAINLRVARLMLEHAGHSVTAALNGQEALDILMQSKDTFDLVLMDCQMPVLDGYETTRSIRRAADVISSLPIIALTAHAMADDRQRCLDSGMDGYVSKPINKQRLFSEIERVLSSGNQPENKSEF